MTKTIAYKGKTIVYDSDDARNIRKRLVTGQSLDAFNEKERLIIVEIAREESVRWNKSNAKRQDVNKTIKKHAHVLKRLDELDDAKRAELEKILNG